MLYFIIVIIAKALDNQVAVFIVNVYFRNQHYYNQGPIVCLYPYKTRVYARYKMSKVLFTLHILCIRFTDGVFTQLKEIYNDSFTLFVQLTV